MHEKNRLNEKSSERSSLSSTALSLPLSLLTLFLSLPPSYAAVLLLQFDILVCRGERRSKKVPANINDLCNSFKYTTKNFVHFVLSLSICLSHTCCSHAISLWVPAIIGWRAFDECCRRWEKARRVWDVEKRVERKLAKKCLIDIDNIEPRAAAGGLLRAEETFCSALHCTMLWCA